MAVYCMRGKEGCVVVYEKLTLPETMLKKLSSLRQCYFYYGIAESETTCSGNDARCVSVLLACERLVQG